MALAVNILVALYVSWRADITHAYIGYLDLAASLVIDAVLLLSVLSGKVTSPARLVLLLIFFNMSRVMTGEECVRVCEREKSPVGVLLVYVPCACAVSICVHKYIYMCV